TLGSDLEIILRTGAGAATYVGGGSAAGPASHGAANGRNGAQGMNGANGANGSGGRGAQMTASAPAPRGTAASPATTTSAGPGSGPITIGPLNTSALGSGTSLSTTVPVGGQAASGGSHRLGARRANRPVRSASSAAAVMTRPAWLLGGWLLRDGVRPLLLAADLTACGVATAIVHRPHWTTFLFMALLVGLYGFGGLYRSRLSLSLLDDVPRIVGRWLAAVALTVLVQTARARADWGTDDVNWSMVITAMTAVIFILALRAIAYNFVRRVRSQRRVAHRTLILGAGHVGEQVARTLLKHSEYGLQPIGFVDNHPLIAPETCAVPLLGGTEHLADVLVREDVRNVVVAFGSVRESQMVDIIRTCDRLRCEIFLVPRLFELHQVSEDMDVVWGLPLVRLRRATYRSNGWHVKRMFDIAFASMALLMLWPLMLAAAIAVRLEGGPGILFRQERVGADGRRFDVLKFRSLRPVDDAESATNWNIKHDDRLGPVGRFLRTSSIDELPQLFNILRGEMSLVGPRPERPHFVAQFRQTYPRYVARHRVPSGLTGWAQVHGLRGDTSIADRAMFDNYYIENWSLWLDVKILLRTVSSVVRGQGG
ncbi:MAG TPA: exopolysaccharide biosynthesis polyprenyl glycosylphosphotransferase, partial [Kineosporiaceae bacterium]|nr:exopolysaccharide biosynthesis polyprenyl glycosylphosphotransferase [Kineosporiaceae bacterium]